MRRTPYVAVVGPGEASPEELHTAEEIGARLADAAVVVVTGGLGGVMEAACRGARSRGGLTVGLLPGSYRADANGWVVVALPTGLGEARNALIVRCADAIVAVGGGWGTLSEIALALRAGLPVVGVDTWQLARDGIAVDGVVGAADGRAAVEEAMRRLGHGAQPRVS
jgi:uncharacterized protein (TIGR00725 family)